MARTRMINTKFWDDSYIIELDPIEKLMFLYFLTNGLTNVCGIYEISLRRIAFDTGIDREMVLKILQRFKKEDKIYYLEGWIIIKNFIKHQSFNQNMKIGAEKVFNAIPDKIWLEIRKNRTLTQSFRTLALSYPILELKLEPESESKLKPKPELKSEVVSKADGTKINSLIEKFKNINPSYERLYSNKSQRSALERMTKKYGFAKMERMINALPEIIRQKFAPRITTPITLENKLGDLVAFVEQEKGGGTIKI